ncbi:transcription antitermination protein NusG [Spiroplasma clarkii]|uniref:Transcription termination/antitermination protein NusG n=3 Tax=Spiroplasma clarkii TaxID=2139 RepID=A0A2K8KGK0_9MOLU|nr:transcription termination/antitermination protein NusG [Spiroplasma clarkii]ATX70372.1 transcription antitermination protein NusG [Spiroplasma clarkii]
MDNKLLELEEELDSYQGQWFVINCNSGHEERVKSDLLQKIETSGLEDRIFDIRISKMPFLGKGGKTVEKNKFPGYIFINMLMTDETWFIVRNTPGVTGFIGSSGKGAKPFPLSIEEVAKMLTDTTEVSGDNDCKGGSTERKEKILYEASFKINDVIVVKDGPFAGVEGQVIQMDYEKGIARVNLEYFGRITTTEFEFDNLELAYKD